MTVLNYKIDTKIINEGLNILAPIFVDMELETAKKYLD